MTVRTTAAVAALSALLPLAWQSRADAQLIRDTDSEARVQWMQMKRELPEYPSKAVQRYAQCVVYAIIDEIPEEFKDLDWEVIVFDSESANAQVLPQGKVAVYSGILRFANTPDKLAAVIGHEVAHLTKGHVGKRVGRGALSTLAGIAGGVATGLGNESQAAANVLFQLPYQREQEIEADLTGMMYAAEAGYNPASVLEIWKDMSEGAEGGTGWLQTHPNPELRLRELAQNLSPSLKVYNDALDAGVRPRCHL